MKFFSHRELNFSYIFLYFSYISPIFPLFFIFSYISGENWIFPIFSVGQNLNETQYERKISGENQIFPLLLLLFLLWEKILRREMHFSMGKNSYIFYGTKNDKRKILGREMHFFMGKNHIFSMGKKRYEKNSQDKKDTRKNSQEWIEFFLSCSSSLFFERKFSEEKCIF